MPNKNEAAAAAGNNDGCLACDLTSGRGELPGGRIYETPGWAVEHCIGPLGIGTLIAKPKRHCVHLADLTDAETLELGLLLRECCAVVTDLLQPDQVYSCLWSHAGWTAGHIHFVVQPIWDRMQADHARPGPFVQVDMFAERDAPPADEVAAFAKRARAAFDEPQRLFSRASHAKSM